MAKNAIRKNGWKVYNVFENVIVHKDLSDAMGLTYIIGGRLGQLMDECKKAHPNCAVWYEMDNVSHYLYANKERQECVLNWTYGNNYYADVTIIYRPTADELKPLNNSTNFNALDVPRKYGFSKVIEDIITCRRKVRKGECVMLCFSLSDEERTWLKLNGFKDMGIVNGKVVIKKVEAVKNFTLVIDDYMTIREYKATVRKPYAIEELFEA